MRFMVALAFFIALPALGQELLHDPHSWVRAVRDRVFQEGTPNRNGSVRMDRQEPLGTAVVIALPLDEHHPNA